MYSSTAGSFADPDVRAGYLARVGVLTLLGLIVAGITGMISAVTIALTPFLQGSIASLVVFFGCYGVAFYVAPRFVYGRSVPGKWFGFLALGAGFEGLAMGYLLLAAISASPATGNPLALITQALGLTLLSALGMTLYLWTKPRELSLVKAGMSALFLPMLVLMGISFVFPITGPIGIAISGLFVLISAGGLLYQINQVLHKHTPEMHIEGAYSITMGLLVLFWNLLVLLMRLQRR